MTNKQPETDDDLSRLSVALEADPTPDGIRFEEAPRSRRASGRTVRRASLVAALALALGGWFFAVRPHSCGGVIYDSDLQRVGDQCIGGVTVGGASFSPDSARITDLIKTQNRWVEASGKPWVRVAVLMPMTGTAPTPKLPGSVYDDHGALPTKSIVNALEGAYLGQYRANTSKAFGEPAVLIELELLNEGSQQADWPSLIPLLKQQTANREHPLVAAVGLGASRQETRDLADRLPEIPLPAVGGVLSAVEANGLINVSPSSRDYVVALDSFLKGRTLTGVIEAVDRNGEPRGRQPGTDLFVHDLHVQYGNVLGRKHNDGRPALHLTSAYFTGSMGAGNVDRDNFTSVMNAVCSGGEPNEVVDTLLFGGRTRDVEPLLEALAAKTCHRRLTVLTGGAGLTVDPHMQALLKKADSTLVIATEADSGGWAKDSTNAPAGYNDFQAQFMHPAAPNGNGKPAGGFLSTDLMDGYAIGHHDAVAVVAQAIHQLRADNDQLVPTAGDVATQLRNINIPTTAVPAASGQLYFPRGSYPCGKAVALTEATGKVTHSLPNVVTCKG